MNLTGSTLTLLPIFMIFSIRTATAIEACPPKEVLQPCICQKIDMMTKIICSNITSMETLVNVFQRSGDRRFSFFVLDHSSLMYLPTESLLSKRFQTLSLENVALTSLFDKVPSDANELHYLILNQAFLQRGVRWDLFENLSKLRYLTVKKTEVKSLGSNFIKYVGDKTITSLGFVETKTAQLDDHVFAKIKGLISVHIGQNKIKILKRSMFPKPAVLKSFVFPDNEIETLPEDIFSDMPELKVVKLRNNRISKFTEPTFGGIFNKLFKLYFQDNPINCDCSIKWFVSRGRRTKVLGTCGEPIDKKGRLISSINKADLDYCQNLLQSGTNMLETIINE